MWIPSISSRITCVPASSVPPRPSNAHFHASGPRLTRNSETICWLPGGRKLVRSEIKSNRLVRRPIGLVANPTAISKVGENARKRLNAMACAIMLQRGKTLPNMFSARFERAADAIISGHYTYGADFPKTRLTSGHIDDSRARRGVDVQCPGFAVSWGNLRFAAGEKW